jgi:hypothetical protein
VIYFSYLSQYMLFSVADDYELFDIDGDTRHCGAKTLRDLKRSEVAKYKVRLCACVFVLMLFTL